MELLQDSAHWDLKTSHACCIAGRTESMLPNSRHFSPKCQRKDSKCRNMWRHLIQLPYHHVRLLWIKTEACQSHGPYMEVCPFGQQHTRNQLSMDGNFPTVVDCEQMPQEVFYEDDGYSSDDNDTDDERITPSKDESEYDWRTSYSCYERTDKHDMMIEHLTIFNVMV